MQKVVNLCTVADQATLRLQQVQKPDDQTSCIVSFVELLQQTAAVVLKLRIG